MTKLVAPILLATLAVTNGFSPAVKPTANNLPYFASAVRSAEPSTPAFVAEPQAAVSLEKTKSAKPQTPKAPKKNKAPAGHSQDGPLAPFVILMKKVVGDDELNKLRGKVIGLHSKVIGSFVDTAETDFGEKVLKTLFYMADKDNSGTIDEQELASALRALGFRHLKEKQIKGIFDRADLDKNGALCYDEWKSNAPSTLRTNLIKLAKMNGGELGFLA